MLSRRQFLKQLGLGMAVGTVGLPVTASPFFSRPSPDSADKVLQVALLADSHLPDANHETGAARNLLTAVTEINAQNPPVDLIFLAGDLTNDGGSEALELGWEILSSLHAPCWLLPGEHDYPATSSQRWKDIFGDGTFSFTHQGIHFCGFNTNVLNPASGRDYFHFSPGHYNWLAKELAHLSPEVPLVIFSHAPLYRLFQPWQWWTKDAESLHDLLQDRKNVYLLHGHVHQNITLQHRNLTFQGLRATAWPLPDVRVGWNALKPSSPGIDNQTGCGWMLLTIGDNALVTLKDQIWQI